jgi:uncharacterized protein (DUF1800 family)
MGRRFPPGEEGHGAAALHFLATHPATYRFLATELVRHFVADDPPVDTLRHIVGVSHDSSGNPGAAAAALITLAPTRQPQTKLRAPLDYMVSTLCALDAPPQPRSARAPVSARRCGPHRSRVAGWIASRTWLAGGIGTLDRLGLRGRRSAPLGLASAFVLGRVSLGVADAPTDKRLAVVILRGRRRRPVASARYFR